jgi:DNA repair protein RecO (recombination protein O)
MAIQKTQASILKSQPFRTSSLIVTAYSRDFGKIKGLVKGVRREGVIRPSAFEPFTLVEIVFYEKIRSEIHLISEVSILETYDNLRRDLPILATAYYLTELIDELTESQDPHESIYELLQFAYQFLPSFPVNFVARLFEVRLLYEIGLLPHLEGCLACGEKNPDKIYFSTRQGAFFCPRCRAKSPEARVIHKKTLEAMRFFIEGELERVLRASLENETEKEMKDVIERFLMDRIGKPLSTRRFLNQVQSLKERNLTPRRLN